MEGMTLLDLPLLVYYFPLALCFSFHVFSTLNVLSVDMALIYLWFFFLLRWSQLTSRFLGLSWGKREWALFHSLQPGSCRVSIEQLWGYQPFPQNMSAVRTLETLQSKAATCNDFMPLFWVVEALLQHTIPLFKHKKHVKQRKEPLARGQKGIISGFVFRMGFYQLTEFPVSWLHFLTPYLPQVGFWDTHAYILAYLYAYVPVESLLQPPYEIRYNHIIKFEANSSYIVMVSVSADIQNTGIGLRFGY